MSQNAAFRHDDPLIREITLSEINRRNLPHFLAFLKGQQLVSYNAIHYGTNNMIKYSIISYYTTFFDMMHYKYCYMIV